MKTLWMQQMIHLKRSQAASSAQMKGMMADMLGGGGAALESAREMSNQTFV
jgi:hypothetical protein